MTAVTPGSAELIASIAGMLEGHSFGLRRGEHHEEVAARIVDEVLRRLAAKPDDPDAMNERRATEDTNFASNVRETTIEECAKIADAVAERADRLMEADPKGNQMLLASFGNGAMECAENIRALSTTGEPKPRTPMPWIDAEEGDMS